MANLKGRSRDMKDKVIGGGKEAYDKTTDDKSKETGGKAQSLGADIKEEARSLDDEIKDKFSRKDEEK